MRNKLMKQKGTMIINIEPYSIAETKFMSKEVQQILKERFKMVSKSVFLGILNRYNLVFDTRDNALQAAAWLNEVLKTGGNVE